MLYEITIKEKSKPIKFYIDHSHLDDLKGYLAERHIDPPVIKRGGKKISTNTFTVRGMDTSTQYDQPPVVRGKDASSQYEYDEPYPFPVPRAPPPAEIILQPEEQEQEQEEEQLNDHLFPKPPYVVEAEIRSINGVRSPSGFYVLKKKVKNSSNTKGYSLKVVGGISAFPSKQEAIDYSYTL